MIEQLQTDIIEGLAEFLALQPVMQDQTGDKPSYPYLGYKFTSIFIPETGQPIFKTELVPSEDENFETDIKYTMVTMDTMVLSFSIYSDDYDQAVSLAFKARNWFELKGYNVLKSFNVVVADIGTIEDRSVFITHEYERRIGFDITFRFTTKVTQQVPTVEIVESEKED